VEAIKFHNSILGLGNDEVKILEKCNIFRDKEMFDLGIIIKDDSIKRWKYLSPLKLEILRQQQNLSSKTLISKTKAAEKLTQRRKDFKKWEYAHLNTVDFFRQVYPNEFTFAETEFTFAETEFTFAETEKTPTLSFDKKPLSKQKLKEVAKIAAIHQGNMSKFIERQKLSPTNDFRLLLLDEIRQLENLFVEI
jgi:hypothetical protein